MINIARKKSTEISVRHRQFADEFILTGNATDAYKKVYPKSKRNTTAQRNANKIKNRPEVKEYINKVMEELHAENIITLNEILSILSSIGRGELTEEVVMMNAVTGEPVKIDKKPDLNTRINALSQMLKRYPTAKQAEKLELEIKKLQAQLENNDETTNVLAEYFEALSELK